MTDVREICNLSEKELRARRAELSTGLATRVRERRDLSDGVTLCFDATPEMREELDVFVAFERECCPTLGLSVLEASGLLQLEIRGVEPGSKLFADFGLVDRSEVASSPRWPRILSAASLGALGALALCCVFPIALVAVLGTAVAAPFTNLDHPGVVSATALGLASGIWFWQRRRDQVRVAAASAGGCGC